MIVVTHYPPTFEGTLNNSDKKLEMGKLYSKASHSDELIQNEIIVKWIYGGTGYNNLCGKLISNQYGQENFQKFTMEL